MYMRSRMVLIGAAWLAAVMLVAGAQTPAQQPNQPKPGQPAPAEQGQQPDQPQREQPRSVRTDIFAEGGPAPRMAVPDFTSESGAEPKVGTAIAEVLWNDLQFEREYYMIPRKTYSAVQTSSGGGDGGSLDGWRELGADFVMVGTVRQNASSLTVGARLYQVSTGQPVFGKEYTGDAKNPRFFAHTIADEIHEKLRGLRGVARTKLAFASDRDGGRAPTSFADRSLKEIYISDYDGENQRRVTVNRSLAITPAWTPDGRAIAYTSYRRGYPDIFLSYIYQGRLEEPAKGNDRVHNFDPDVSPDGKRVTFWSNRDGNPEIYVMNIDGSNVRRITKHPGNDSTPTWSPGGNEVAFTSDRSGGPGPQIYIASADGLGRPRRLTNETYCDRATWSPPPLNEIAYASRTGPGFDIKVLEVATGQVRQITDGQGSNESPAWAPNGRHLAFTSTRSGNTQVFTVARDGRGLRQITKAGSNYGPSWSQ